VDLNEAVGALAPRVLRYAVARLGDRSLAEEVAQESLTALVRHCRNGGPPPESAE
jgi:DNA-directed RNA polymerase specialized sigma24 family protein